MRYYSPKKLKSFFFIFLLGLSLSSSAQSSSEDEQKTIVKIEPKLTEVWEPEPPVVDPGENQQAPSDAIILFDGSSTADHWESVNGEPIKWEVSDDEMTVVKGTGPIRTKEGFGDVQLHIEWSAPTQIEGDGQGRGNSGIFFMEKYELQVLDSYNNRTYSNGQAASIYKQHIPLVNAMRPPGEWQVYDVVFMAPTFNEDGTLRHPATMTVFHNGVLVQNHVELIGPTQYNELPRYQAHEAELPLVLQDHSNPIKFRNIWLRKL